MPIALDQENKTVTRDASNMLEKNHEDRCTIDNSECQSSASHL